MTNATRIFSINVDMQNDFCPGGSLPVANGTDVIQPMNDINTAVRQAGGQVIFTRDFHPEKTSHFIEYGGQFPTHCVAGTPGAEFQESVAIEAEDVIISKGTQEDEDAFSGFQGTDSAGRTLAEIVEPKGKEKVAYIIGGLATEYCDKATILDALKIEPQDQVEVYAVTDAMLPVEANPGDGAAALTEVEQAGAMMTTAREIIERIARAS